MRTHGINGQASSGNPHKAKTRHCVISILSGALAAAALSAGAAWADGKLSLEVEKAKRIVGGRLNSSSSPFWPSREKFTAAPMNNPQGLPPDIQWFRARTSNPDTRLTCLVTEAKAYCGAEFAEFGAFLKDYKYFEKLNLGKTALYYLYQKLGCPRDYRIISPGDTGYEVYPDLKAPEIMQSKDGLLLTFHAGASPRSKAALAKWTMTVSPGHSVTLVKDKPARRVFSPERQLVENALAKASIDLSTVDVVDVTDSTRVPPGAKVFAVEWREILDSFPNYYVAMNGQVYYAIEGGFAEKAHPNEFSRLLRDTVYLDKLNWDAGQLAHLFIYADAPGLTVVGYPVTGKKQNEVEPDYNKDFVTRFPGIKPPAARQSKNGIRLTFYAYPYVQFALPTDQSPSKWTVTVTSDYQVSVHVGKELKPKK